MLSLLYNLHLLKQLCKNKTEKIQLFKKTNPIHYVYRQDTNVKYKLCPQ